MTVGLTIGQAARFVGVTVKTVRHYHRLGLLEEPARDTSGYRRYSSADLLRLVQVRTLAGAGVPLAEIASLLDADAEAFARALVEVEHQLDARIDELVERRSTLRRLTNADRALLPERAGAILDRLAALDLDPAFVEAQRESLVLARAVAPELFDGYLDQLEQRLGDPHHVALLARSWEAATWAVDDPRLEELADAMADNLLAHREQLAMPAGFEARTDAAARYQLINQYGADDRPALARLTTLVDARLRAAGLDVPR